MIKTSLATVVAAFIAATALASPANAIIRAWTQPNGVDFNGVDFNGKILNGVDFNGRKLNGRNAQGASSARIEVVGIVLPESR